MRSVHGSTLCIYVYSTPTHQLELTPVYVVGKRGAAQMTHTRTSVAGGLAAAVAAGYVFSRRTPKDKSMVVTRHHGEDIAFPFLDEEQMV